MLSRVCGKKFFVGLGVRIQESGFRSQNSGVRIQEIILFILPTSHTPTSPLHNSYFVLFVKKTFFLQ
ncbi:MAG: hypothetical protein EWV75_01475 [Microcystis wesenbergii Mw_QC_S_20081001_S30D]|uniref:Uncharacterized protein n=1 Tax=Microcystis wesenbergii Mw_QC_S_20081001_S30D TaxID=2486245 RepID=A0A552JZM9_9CHRO|nr:hypothetical protein [Microcystis aeruginosa W11-03]NCR95471.1 hypothetical protein [Microcystis aeruginosa W11-06]TRU97154.1 MAG: hypothetical protein EWV73_17325 [Microcystis wesenbergii Mw_QC_B_20070930_S4D]TRV01213.1 MAG: hypothetical protein EWV75_01475 [Microcystis wesenbergii Mw_QC_S_20081001_S30D]